jgi:undecaprenyl-diphosphatase
VVVDLVLVFALSVLFWHSAHADRVDSALSNALYAAPDSPLRDLMSAVSVLGLPAVAILLSALVAAWARARVHDWVLGAFCPAAVIASVCAESVLKLLVRRARPTTAVLAHVHGHSFPSGHAAAATALACSAALLVVATQAPRRRVAVLALVTYAATVCVSRIVLGVHYLTDVVAGAALAVAIVLLMAMLLARVVEQRGRQS